MNDRFKFRVWDIEEWAYLKCKYSKSAGYHKYTFGKHDVWHDIGYFIENNPKYYIVEQCTGLKDKNGNLIYEGDIVKIPDDYETYGFMSGEKREVYFRDGGFRLKPKDTKLGCGHWLEQTSALEIIGNIHEQAKQKDK